jgi:hypothetical protein
MAELLFWRCSGDTPAYAIFAWNFANKNAGLGGKSPARVRKKRYERRNVGAMKHSSVSGIFMFTQNFP